MLSAVNAHMVALIVASGEQIFASLSMTRGDGEVQNGNISSEWGHQISKSASRPEHDYKNSRESNRSTD
jgi:hypothetical protein